MGVVLVELFLKLNTVWAILQLFMEKDHHFFCFKLIQLNTRVYTQHVDRLKEDDYIILERIANKYVQGVGCPLVLWKALHKNSTQENIWHQYLLTERGCNLQTVQVKVQWVRCGKCNGQALFVGLWGWKEMLALLLKSICQSEYAAAVLPYQCMSSPAVDSLTLDWGLMLPGWVCVGAFCLSQLCAQFHSVRWNIALENPVCSILKTKHSCFYSIRRLCVVCTRMMCVPEMELLWRQGSCAGGEGDNTQLRACTEPFPPTHRCTLHSPITHFHKHPHNGWVCRRRI